MVIAFVACLFLKEIPLRKAGGSAGMASLAEGGHVSAEEEPSTSDLLERELAGIVPGEDSLLEVEAERGEPEIIGPPLGDD
jgi:hypothetical protein